MVKGVNELPNRGGLSTPFFLIFGDFEIFSRVCGRLIAAHSDTRFTPPPVLINTHVSSPPPATANE